MFISKRDHHCHLRYFPSMICSSHIFIVINKRYNYLTAPRFAYAILNISQHIIDTYMLPTTVKPVYRGNSRDQRVLASTGS